MTGSAPFGGRAGHQVAVLPPAPFIRVPAGIRATGPGAFGVYVDGQTPVTLGTLEVAGALGAPSFGLTDDARNVATVRMDGALVVTNLLATGERATVTVTVGDSGSAYGTTMAVTMAFVEPLSLATESAWYEVSPDYAGAVHSLSVGGRVWRCFVFAGDDAAGGGCGGGGGVDCAAGGGETGDGDDCGAGCGEFGAVCAESCRWRGRGGLSIMCILSAGGRAAAIIRRMFGGRRMGGGGSG